MVLTWATVTTMQAMLGIAASAAALLLLALAPLGTDAHAVMLKPESRAWYDYLLRYNYNPHAVYAGGVDSVSNKGKLKWPARARNSICGDAVGENKWDKPGPMAKSGFYKPGQTISIDVLFAQNHLGRMIIRVCPLDARDEKECQDLERADGKGKAWDLPWSGKWEGVTSGFVAPNYQDGFFKTYKLSPIGKGEGCITWACDQFKGMYVYTTQWKLPSGFTCDHCKLQMYYLTGSRCWPPQLPGISLRKTVAYDYCGAPGATYPEEFWNCADVRIK